ncbi:hypothetical protein V2J09_001267 [Rumex salicifolius]
MSPSTMSITASPIAAARRRPVVSGETNKINVDPVNDGIISPLANKNVVIDSPGEDGKIAGGRKKDLNHSIRAGKVLDSVQKRLPPNSTSFPRRTRKMASKPRWQTVLSMVRNLVIGTGSDESVNLAGFSDMEGRIADVESFLKRTTTMLQLQLEAVDKKLDGEFAGLRGEMNKKFEETSEETESRLTALDEKNAILEKALGQLTSKDLLSKEDFGRLYEELKKSKNGDLGQSELSLDEIKALARQIVVNEIERHAADGLGMIDYALGTAGAMVVQHSEPHVVEKGGNWFSTTNTQRKLIYNNAEKMLKPSFGEPGQCFPLKGNSGYVQIRLRTAIIPEAITLEHVAKIAFPIWEVTFYDVQESLAYDRSSAPRDCLVFGWLQGQQGTNGLDTEVDVYGEKMLLLTKFTYDLEKSNAQTFNVLASASSVVDTIRFDFSSNHGSPSHTCIYRVRVHGHEPNMVSHVG